MTRVKNLQAHFSDYLTEYVKCHKLAGCFVWRKGDFTVSSVSFTRFKITKSCFLSVVSNYKAVYERFSVKHICSKNSFPANLSCMTLPLQAKVHKHACSIWSSFSSYNLWTGYLIIYCTCEDNMPSSSVKRNVWHLLSPAKTSWMCQLMTVTVQENLGFNCVYNIQCP